MPILVRSNKISASYQLKCFCGCHFRFQLWEVSRKYLGESYEEFRIQCPECSTGSVHRPRILCILKIRWYHKLWNRLFHKRPKTFTDEALRCLEAGVTGEFTRTGDASLESLKEAYLQAEKMPALAGTTEVLRKEISKAQKKEERLFEDWAAR